MNVSLEHFQWKAVCPYFEYKHCMLYYFIFYKGQFLFTCSGKNVRGKQVGIIEVSPGNNIYLSNIVKGGSCSSIIFGKVNI